MQGQASDNIRNETARWDMTWARTKPQAQGTAQSPSDGRSREGCAQRSATLSQQAFAERVQVLRGAVPSCPPFAPLCFLDQGVGDGTGKTGCRTAAGLAITSPLSLVQLTRLVPLKTSQSVGGGLSS